MARTSAGGEGVCSCVCGGPAGEYKVTGGDPRGLGGEGGVSVVIPVEPPPVNIVFESRRLSGKSENLRFSSLFHDL